MKELTTDVCVIGGGPAGMAAALEAHRGGAQVVVIERDWRLGGILQQCIHDGLASCALEISHWAFLCATFH